MKTTNNLLLEEGGRNLLLGFTRGRELDIFRNIQKYKRAKLSNIISCFSRRLFNEWKKVEYLKTSFILSGLGMIRFMSPDTESNIWAGLFHKV